MGVGKLNGGEARPLKMAPFGRHHHPLNLRAEGGNIKLIARRAIPQPSGPKAPSNLRTLRPIGPVNPKNLFHNLFLQPFYTTCGGAAPLFFEICGEAATTTLGPKGRQT